MQIPNTKCLPVTLWRRNWLQSTNVQCDAEKIKHCTEVISKKNMQSNGEPCKFWNLRSSYKGDFILAPKGQYIETKYSKSS